MIVSDDVPRGHELAFDLFMRHPDVAVLMVPKDSDVLIGARHQFVLGDVPLMALTRRTIVGRFFFLKRALDLVVSLVGLIFLALFGALVQVNKSAMVVATIFAFVGIAVYFASHQAFAMLSLSDQYMSATGEEHQVMLLAAGEALLAIHNPGGIYQGTGMYVSLFLVLLAGLIVSIVMLQGDRLGRIAAIVGILANGFGLAYFIALIFWPEILWIPPTLSAPFRMIWYILIAVKLFKLSRGENWTGKRIK